MVQYFSRKQNPSLRYVDTTNIFSCSAFRGVYHSTCKMRHLIAVFLISCVCGSHCTKNFHLVHIVAKGVVVVGCSHVG